ncbi:radical SAM protein [Azospirillum sp. TSO22-1]|uniref:radical SAM/SPASM domain-containing protein n=1 Tax=Azospirillum sp. TSO22-1 TaxID=716789 RepID=UPI000D65200C|nr:radical SAM protein [Azospirillum sp. TSO22-1]
MTSADTENAEAVAALPVPDLPPRILMDLRTDCNLKCPMCIVHGDPENPAVKGILRRSMSVEQSRRILDEVMAAKPLIQPSLWSEPTLAHDFQEHVRAMKERGATVAMNTNGLLLTEATARFLVEAGVDSVSVSVDSMTPETLMKVRGINKLDKIHRGIENLLAARGDAATPRIGVSFTLQDANRHELDAFVAHWTRKVDVVRVGELFIGPDGFPNVRTAGPRQPCHALYSTMAIHVDGNVSLCCLDGFGDTNVGNVFKDGVRGVWHGPKLTEVRRLHEQGRYDEVPFCTNCDRWASNAYEEEIRDGLLIRRSAEYTYYNRIDRLTNWTGSLQNTHASPTLAQAGQTAGDATDGQSGRG